MECEFCKSSFSTNKVLKAHQKTAKYCLEKQVLQNKVVEYMICDCCKRKFTTKREFKDHKEKCIDIKDNEIKNLRDEIRNLRDEIRNIKEENKDKIIIKDNKILELETELKIYKNLSSESQECIKEIAKQPKTTLSNTTNTNNIMNLAPLDMNVLTEKLKTVINEQMTEAHLLEGQEGLAKLLAPCFILEDGRKLITCTDTSRNVWKSKDTNGNILKDVKANNIAKTVQPLAVSKADILIDLDGKKRTKIYELRDIEKRKKERLELDEKDEATMKGMKVGSGHYRMYEERIRKRNEDRVKDQEVEEQLLQEFREADELYLINLDDDDKPFKLYAGKEDIKNLKEDSVKFSNSLITLV
jgi:hypothetical protein